MRLRLEQLDARAYACETCAARDAFTPVYPDAPNPTLWLQAPVVVLGGHFRIDAFAVTTDESGCQRGEARATDEALALIRTAIGADGPFETVDLLGPSHGHSYVLVMTPES